MMGKVEFIRVAKSGADLSIGSTVEAVLDDGTVVDLAGVVQRITWEHKAGDVPRLRLDVLGVEMLAEVPAENVEAVLVQIGGNVIADRWKKPQECGDCRHWGLPGEDGDSLRSCANKATWRSALGPLIREDTDGGTCECYERRQALRGECGTCQHWGRPDEYGEEARFCRSDALQHPTFGRPLKIGADGRDCTHYKRRQT